MKNAWLVISFCTFFIALMTWQISHVFAAPNPLTSPISSPITPSPTSQPITGPITSPEPSCSLALLGDIDCDGSIGIFDYNIFVTNFNKTGIKVAGDIDNSGKVDIFDYNILVTNFGKTA